MKIKLTTPRLISEIAEFLLGRKYYAVVMDYPITGDCEMAQFIFLSRADAETYVFRNEDNMTIKPREIVSFRSRHDYTNLSTFNVRKFVTL